MKRNEQQSIIDVVSVYEKSKTLIETVVDNLGISILICDERGFVYRANQEMAKVFNHSMENFPGARIHDYLDLQEVQKILWGFQQLRNGAHDKIQLECKVNKAHEVKTLFFEVKILATESQRVLFTLSGADITEFQKLLRKQTHLERQLEAAQKKNLRLVIHSILNSLGPENNNHSVSDVVVPKLLKELPFEVASFHEYSEMKGTLKRLFSVTKKDSELNYSEGGLSRKDEISLQKEHHWLVQAFKSKCVQWHTFESGFAGDMKVKSVVLLYLGNENTGYGILELRSHSLASREEFYFELLTEVAEKLSFLFVQSELRLQIDEKNLLLENATKMIALGEMSGGIAHEINNPLTIIYGKLRNVLNALKSGNYDEENVTNSIQYVLKSLDRITNIVKGLKVFSREGMVDELVDLDIRTVINSAISICSERFQNAGIEISSFMKDPIFVRGNENQLVQVVLHLLNNSYDALASMTEQWVKINMIEDSASMYLYITDSGSGIPEAVSRKVMQPFFTTKEPGKGTGLGLSISFGIVKAHGGDLYLNYHHPNTQFVIRLPKQLKN